MADRTGLSNFLATDNVPDALFGIPVVSREDDYTERDLAFFREHPEAGGYYDLGEGTPDDGSDEGAPVQNDEPAKFYGLRSDGSIKGPGWIGEVPIPGGGIATEYAVGVNLDGKDVEIPLFVPTLNPSEVKTLAGETIPNNGAIPDAIMDKAIAFARENLARGQSPFKPSGIETFASRNPSLFKHVKKFETLKLEPYDDVGGLAIGYGAHLDADGNLVTKDTKIDETQAISMLARDLYTRRQRLAETLPNWKYIPGNAKQALLDVSMGRDDVLSAAQSGGLHRDLKAAGRNADKLLAAVKKHYYSYRKSDNPNHQAGLETRRIAGGKLFFGEDFSYDGKTWDSVRGFVAKGGL